MFHRMLLFWCWQTRYNSMRPITNNSGHAAYTRNNLNCAPRGNDVTRFHLKAAENTELHSNWLKYHLHPPCLNIILMANFSRRDPCRMLNHLS